MVRPSTLVFNALLAGTAAAHEVVPAEPAPFPTVVTEGPGPVPTFVTVVPGGPGVSVVEPSEPGAPIEVFPGEGEQGGTVIATATVEPGEGGGFPTATVEPVEGGGIPTATVEPVEGGGFYTATVEPDATYIVSSGGGGYYTATVTATPVVPVFSSRPPPYYHSIVYGVPVPARSSSFIRVHSSLKPQPWYPIQSSSPGLVPVEEFPEEIHVPAPGYNNGPIAQPIVEGPGGGSGGSGSSPSGNGPAPSQVQTAGVPRATQNAVLVGVAALVGGVMMM